MAWIETDEGIWEHHKTVRLKNYLGLPLPHVVGLLISLWHFVLRNAWRDADLEPWGDDGIEAAARWEGKRGEFVTALRDCKFLNDYAVHGWLERAGKLVQDRLYNEKRRQDAVGQNDNAVKRRKNAVKRTLPNPTIPYQTVKNILPSPAAGSEDGFEAFWIAYPHSRRGKNGKGEARKLWARLKPSENLREQIQSSLQAHAGSEQWTKEGGQYIPDPAKWLRHSGWENEVGNGKEFESSNIVE